MNTFAKTPRYLFGFDLAQQGNDDLQTILNLAATAELFAVEVKL